MNCYFKLLWLLLISLFISSCGTSHQTKTKDTSTYVVKAMPVHETLFFTGTVQPIAESTLTSPMDAVVEAMHFHYGQTIKKDEVVLNLNSSELQKQYNELLTEYLKSKDSYTIARAKFVGTQDLWESGLLAKNNYLSEKSSLTTNRVSLMQATRKLHELLDKMDDKRLKNFEGLSLADFKEVKKLLTASHNSIKLKAPHDGVLLYPPKSDDKSTRVAVGSALKSGQVIALIGNLKGVSIEIEVPEIDIEKIHKGMQASITGVAFGKKQLKGTLVAVNAQASNSGNGGLPFFTAIVEVPALTKEEQTWIKVGMSANVELRVNTENQLMIPIAAVSREAGHSMVTLDVAAGKTEKRLIVTGPAQADSVVITAGLKAGDKVIYHG